MPHEVRRIAVVHDRGVIVYLSLLLARQVPVVRGRRARAPMATVHHIRHVRVLVQELRHLKVGGGTRLLHIHATVVQMRIVNTAHGHVIISIVLVGRVLNADQLLGRDLLSPVDALDRVGTHTLHQLMLLLRVATRSRDLGSTAGFGVSASV